MWKFQVELEEQTVYYRSYNDNLAYGTIKIRKWWSWVDLKGHTIFHEYKSTPVINFQHKSLFYGENTKQKWKN